MLRSFLIRLFGRRSTQLRQVSPERSKPTSGPLPSVPLAPTDQRPKAARWRNEVISQADITVGGYTVTTSLEFSTSSGLLRVVGESHYQDTLRAAKQTSDDAEPVFLASLVAEPTNPYDPNAVRVDLEPLGTIGYLARESAKRYGPMISAALPTSVRCPAKIEDLDGSIRLRPRRRGRAHCSSAHNLDRRDAGRQVVG